MTREQALEVAVRLADRADSLLQTGAEADTRRADVSARLAEFWLRFYREMNRS